MYTRTMNTLQEYLDAVLVAQRFQPEWRYGQILYNVLSEYRPDLAKQVDGTSLDPFYLAADQTTPFILWLIDNLDT